MVKHQTDWYASWFNTPYYHVLYKDRDHSEAESFMAHLVSYLNLPENAKVLDLACGKGRHSIYLNSLGFNVTGLDLSEKSITYAKQFENEHLQFRVHDMSKPYHEQFDAVFNLFTSFGYFDNEEDNLNTLKAIKSNLNDNGIAVIDFMNVDYVINNLVEKNTKVRQGIEFTEQRSVSNGFIIKDIYFKDQEKEFQYQERVKAFTLNDFKLLFEESGLTLLEIFGDYKLNKFLPENSERLIMLVM